MSVHGMSGKTTKRISVWLRSLLATATVVNAISGGLPDPVPEPDFAGPIENVTVAVGREAVLSCSVTDLGTYKVGWLRASDQTVLALQGRVVTHNARISVAHEDAHTWRLRIRQLRESDRGCYMCQINASPMKKQLGCVDVHVPPDISDQETSSDVTAQEGEDATLHCAATGHPVPRVTWRREDGTPLLLRQTGRELVKVDSYNGSSLRLSRLERRQMGAYLCIAANDVPPAVSKRVLLHVHFAPSVRAPSQLLGAPLGSDVQLECHVEASPTPVSYWLRGGRGQGQTQGQGVVQTPGQTIARPEMLLDGKKHEITEEKISAYKFKLRLTIRSFGKRDLGTYSCVSTNSLGRAEGTVRLYEIKVPTRPPTLPTEPSTLPTTTQPVTIVETTTELTTTVALPPDVLPSESASPRESPVNQLPHPSSRGAGLRPGPAHNYVSIAVTWFTAYVIKMAMNLKNFRRIEDFVCAT